MKIFASILAAVLSASKASASGLRHHEEDRKLTSEALPTSSFSTTVDGDDVDVYHPETGAADEYPMVVFLNGGNTDKSNYAGYATALAEYGNVVAIANHFRVLGPPDSPPLIFASIDSALELMDMLKVQDGDSTSPIFEMVDTTSLILTGHSFGGAVGLFAVAGVCGPTVTIPGGYSIVLPVFCDPPFLYTQPPPELKAGVFFGTNTQEGVDQGCIDSGGSVEACKVYFDPGDTSFAPIILLQGSIDGTATPEETNESYNVRGHIDPTKALITFDGLNHWGVADGDVRPGEPLQTQSVEWAHAKLAKWTNTAIKAHAYGDPDSFDKLYVKKKGETDIVIDSEVAI